MINLPIVYQALGILLYLESLLLAGCMCFGLWAGETDLLMFGVPALVAIVLGILLRVAGRHADPHMDRRDGFLIVSLTWVVFSLVGMLPWLVSGWQPRVAAAFFETMSGFSTTGATVMTHIDSLPRSLLLWRSITHWLGGMGIVFFTIALLPNMGGDLKLFAAEATGLKVGKLHPRIGTTARWLWSLYFMLTLGGAVCYFAAGMNWFDAINHAMSTVATGGFSTHQESLAYFQSPAIEWVAVGFMLLAGTNFTLLYLFFVKRRMRDVLRDGELRLYLCIFAISTVVSATLVAWHGHAPWYDAIRLGAFYSISLQSTTGLTLVDYMAWPTCLWLLFTIVSLVGACAGSTSGGIKCIRVLTTMKIIKTEFKQTLHPHAVLPIRVNNTTIRSQVARSIFVFLSLYGLLVVAGVIVFCAMDMPLLDAFGLCLSAINNVGPCVGHVVSPTGAWDVLNDAQLWILSFLMLAGRLEIFSILLPFTAAFWREE